MIDLADGTVRSEIIAAEQCVLAGDGARKNNLLSIQNGDMRRAMAAMAGRRLLGFTGVALIVVIRIRLAGDDAEIAREASHGLAEKADGRAEAQNHKPAFGKCFHRALQILAGVVTVNWGEKPSSNDCSPAD